MDEDEDDLKDKSSCSAKEKEPFLGKKETPPPPYQHHTAHPISEGDSSDSNSSNNNTSSVKHCTRKYKVRLIFCGFPSTFLRRPLLSNACVLCIRWQWLIVLRALNHCSLIKDGVQQYLYY